MTDEEYRKWRRMIEKRDKELTRARNRADWFSKSWRTRRRYELWDYSHPYKDSDPDFKKGK